MFTEILTVAAGIALVLVLGEVIVRNAVAVAHRYHLSGGFIGLTILSIGTSIPEIMTHVVASLNIVQQPDSMDALSALVVAAAVVLVRLLPLSASFFGVLFIGIAAALPELSTALVSIIKGEKEVSAGILIGSNVTNPLLGVGAGAVISGYTIPGVVIYYDLPVKMRLRACCMCFCCATKTSTDARPVR